MICSSVNRERFIRPSPGKPCSFEPAAMPQIMHVLDSVAALLLVDVLAYQAYCERPGWPTVATGWPLRDFNFLVENGTLHKISKPLSGRVIDGFVCRSSL